MTIDIISIRISMEVWDQARIKPATLGSAVRLATEWATGPGVLPKVMKLLVRYIYLFYVSSTIFQLNRDGSSWVEPVLARINVSCSRTTTQ